MTYPFQGPFGKDSCPPPHKGKAFHLIKNATECRRAAESFGSTFVASGKFGDGMPGCMQFSNGFAYFNELKKTGAVKEDQNRFCMHRVKRNHTVASVKHQLEKETLRRLKRQQLRAEREKEKEKKKKEEGAKNATKNAALHGHGGAFLQKYAR